MDFLIGIILVIISILLFINFTTISISDTKYGNSSCSLLPNSLFNGNQNNTLNSLNKQTQMYTKPANMHNGYDYSKYFFIS